MKRMLVLLLGWCLVTVAVAQDTPEDPKAKKAQAAKEAAAPKPATHDQAVEILKKVDAAAKKVKSARYKASLSSDGWLVSAMPTAEGTVILAGGFSNGMLETYVVDAKVRMPGSEEVRRITSGADGENFYLVDWSNKKVHEDLDPTVMGTDGNIALGLTMVEFVHPAPFNDEINADAAELKESAKVGDEDCYVIDVRYKGGQARSVWYFSKKDFLPRTRKSTRRSRATGEIAWMTLAISGLEVDPKLGEAVFKSTVPDGFEKTDEFAPNRSRLR